MTKTTKKRILFWIENILFLVSIIVLLDGYYELYKFGHIHCVKYEIERITNIKTSFCGSLILFYIYKRGVLIIEKYVFTLKKNLIILVQVLGIIFLCSLLMALLFTITYITDSINRQTIEIVNKDGIRVCGIVKKCYSKDFGKRYFDGIYNFIDFQYIKNSDTIDNCYCIGSNIDNNYRYNDTVYFRISKSQPDYFLIEKDSKNEIKKKDKLQYKIIKTTYDYIPKNK